MARHILQIAGLLSILLLSCTQVEKKRIVYLHPSVNRMRFVQEGNFITERLNQLGAKATMVDANDDEALQISKGMKLVDEGVDMLIIVPVNGNTIAPLVRYAKEKGVAVMAYNRLINNTDYDFFVTGDNVNNAEIFCTAALSKKPSGNYVILAGDRFDRNGYELKLAIDSILKPHVKNGNINIVYESYIELWSREAAAFELDQVIQSWGTDIDVVIASGDQMALGVIGILKKYNIETSVVVTGQNAEKESVENIIKGNQSITIYHPHKILGYKTAEVAIALLNGDKPNKLSNATSFNGTAYIPTLRMKSVAITKDNYVKELIETGEYKMSDFE
jgi:D-xylose transport system substrate-binding protein